MSNPWLEVPLADYEGHMASPAVQQSGVLADVFADVLRVRAPRSVIVLGIAGGNGLDRVDTAQTTRIVGVDINPEYIDATRSRYSNLTGLELHCANLSQARLAIEPAALVHAALIFEHAGTTLCLENALSLVAPDGALSVVLQLPTTGDANVGSSNYASIQKHKDHFQLIDPDAFTADLEQRGFRLSSHSRHPLVSGKAFWTGTFLR